MSSARRESCDKSVAPQGIHRTVTSSADLAHFIYNSFMQLAFEAAAEKITESIEKNIPLSELEFDHVNGSFYYNLDSAAQSFAYSMHKTAFKEFCSQLKIWSQLTLHLDTISPADTKATLLKLFSTEQGIQFYNDFSQRKYKAFFVTRMGSFSLEEKNDSGFGETRVEHFPCPNGITVINEGLTRTNDQKSGVAYEDSTTPSWSLQDIYDFKCKMIDEQIIYVHKLSARRKECKEEYLPWALNLVHTHDLLKIKPERAFIKINELPEQKYDEALRYFGPNDFDPDHVSKQKDEFIQYFEQETEKRKKKATTFNNKLKVALLLMNLIKDTTPDPKLVRKAYADLKKICGKNEKLTLQGIANEINQINASRPATEEDKSYCIIQEIYLGYKAQLEDELQKLKGIAHYRDLCLALDVVSFNASYMDHFFERMNLMPLYEKQKFLEYCDKGEMEIMYVIPPREDMTLGKDSFLVRIRASKVRTPHPTMVGGVEPRILTGGTLKLGLNDQNELVIEEIRYDSGHFRPGIYSLNLLTQYFTHCCPQTILSKECIIRSHAGDAGVLGSGIPLYEQALRHSIFGHESPRRLANVPLSEPCIADQDTPEAPGLGR